MTGGASGLPGGAAGTGADLVALLFVPAVVLGIHWMRSPETARRGNWAGAAGMLGFILATLGGRGALMDPGLWAWMAGGALAGLLVAQRARMIHMPQLVAAFNGIGGAASALVARLALDAAGLPATHRGIALAAVFIGALTFSGSAVAALKLARLLSPAPRTLPHHGLWCAVPLAAAPAVLLWDALAGDAVAPAAALAMGGLGGALGLLLMARVGGADMPVSISLLNALSGVAAAIAGYAVGNPATVAVGLLVGSGGLMLTSIMCRAMNRRLIDILTARGLTVVSSATAAPVASMPPAPADAPETPDPTAPSTADAAVAAPTADDDPVAVLAAAKRVVIVPGYGMALAQAQQAVKALYEALERRGADVCFAIHPVAGRMPGHMHILLAEVNLPYDRFRDLEEINPRFAEMDVAVIIGANDVVNPAAHQVEGTPISGMPVLKVEDARRVVVCNLDRRPGYAGVPNPLFDHPRTLLCLGNAAETVQQLAQALATGQG
jgi:NAD/NADP transhydrogenase beta subunit